MQLSQAESLALGPATASKVPGCIWTPCCLRAPRSQHGVGGAAVLSNLESAPWSGEAGGSEWSQFICGFKSPSRQKVCERAV